MAWNYDLKHSEASKTNLTFKNLGEGGEFNAADIGNYHAGYTGTNVGIPQYLQKVCAWTG